MSERLEKRGRMTNTGYFLKDLQRSQMKNKTLDKEEIKQNLDDFAFYFLIVMMVIIVSFFLFKSEILLLIFSQLL
jgi:signal transduction histidine kinase